MNYSLTQWLKKKKKKKRVGIKSQRLQFPILKRMKALIPKQRKMMRLNLQKKTLMIYKFLGRFLNLLK